MASTLQAASRQHPNAGAESGTRARLRARTGLHGSGLYEPLLDVVMVAIALVAVRWSATLGDIDPAPLGWALAFGVLIILALALAGAYRPRFTLHFLDDARQILGATAIAAMTVSFARLLVGDEADIASEASRLWLFAAAYVVAGRGAYQLVRARSRRLGLQGQPTLIVGAGDVGHWVARRLLDRPEFGLRPVAFLDPQPLDSEQQVDLPVIPGRGGERDSGAALLADLREGIAEYGVRHVILAFSLTPYEQELALVRGCDELGVSVSLVPRLFEGVPDQTRLERIGGIPLISVHPANPRNRAYRAKYAVDRVAAAFALVLASPVLLVAALGTAATIGRPILFRQRRVGLDGRDFQMLKFRTMRGSPERRGEADVGWAARMAGVDEGSLGAHDVASPGAEGRTTGFGRTMRRAGIDELPQLLNVLRGDMSLVGPRPERHGYVELFERSVRRYTDRHRVKAGLTGWAQVHGLRGETSLADRIEWDNYYIENWSPWLDIKILALTFAAVVRDRR
jgi:exopolysaccharide biosynthesis polyprenyl glycosylphosphotransferase